MKRHVDGQPFLPDLSSNTPFAGLPGQPGATMLTGSCLDLACGFPAESFQAIICSPPYFALRDYSVAPQDWPEVRFRPVLEAPSLQTPAMRCALGHEQQRMHYVGHLVHVFRTLRPLLRRDGLLAINLGDSYSGARRYTPDSGLTERQGSLLHANDATKRGMLSVPRTPDSGLPKKNLMGIPWLIALALQADGWRLRSDVIWNKPNPVPESVSDRPSRCHEHILLLSKQERYFWDADAVRMPCAPATIERGKYHWSRGGTKSHDYQAMNGLNRDAPFPDSSRGRNLTDVWTITLKKFSEGHFAVYPPDLVERCILAMTPAGGVCSACRRPWQRGDEWRPVCACSKPAAPALILDPFAGAGTTLAVASHHGRHGIGFELNPEFAAMLPARQQSVDRSLARLEKLRRLSGRNQDPRP